MIVQNGDPRKEVIALGQTYFAKDPNKRISAKIGQYGELEIIKQERVKSNSGKTMNDNEKWSPGVLIQSDNTSMNDRDLNGEYSDTKVVFNKKDFDNYTMDKESATTMTVLLSVIRIRICSAV